MSNTIKVSLNIELVGRTRVKSSKPIYSKVHFTKKELHPHVKMSGKEGKQVEKTITVKYYPTQSIPASEVLNLNVIAYNYMISKECPTFFKNKKKWEKLTNKERLEQHLQNLTEHLGGVSYNYTIL